ncbi:winged helix-turn-helix domain-containing protein [Novosphingobium tardum]|uniref:Winged helix-turn-helix domain-containing protein n=1 Tax=Novosphingobium tardum TaxID=1538021 RepID=A0ABV8RJW1_9SPHN
MALGRIRVDPPTLTVSSPAGTEALEPRVMRVLVALASANGAVLSRDELIGLCWDGQIVGDNAINRVISRLRNVFQRLGGDSVRLETITKVGFRIVADPPAAPGEVIENATLPAADPSPAPAGMSRRWALGGALAAGAAGVIAYAAWPGGPRHVPAPAALDLYNRGMALQKAAQAGGTAQAMRFYQQAVEIDPDFADAWGALAIGYRHGLDGYTNEEKRGYPRLLRSAARRALALDPDQVDARMALVSIRPFYRRWMEAEGDLRGIARRYPDYWYVNAQLAMLLEDVGRIEEGLAYRKRVNTIDPFLPVSHAFLARTLLYAGRDQEADAALEVAFRRWRAHPVLWIARFGVLIAGERFVEAAAFARDPRALPEDFPPTVPATYAAMADALAADDAVGKAKAAEHMRAALGEDIASAPRFVPLLASLGATDDVFVALGAYLLGGRFAGRNHPAPGPLDNRNTVVLWSPQLRALGSDPRYAALLRASGVEDYWRRSGSSPDFRRSGSLPKS